MRILCAQVMYTVYMYKSTVINHKYIRVHMYIVDRHRKSVTRSYQAVGAVSLLLSIIGVWAMAELPELPCLRVQRFTTALAATRITHRRLEAITAAPWCTV